MTDEHMTDATSDARTPSPPGEGTTGQFSGETGSSGQWVRQRNWFHDRVRSDGVGKFAVEAGRYHLIVSLACPWAHRSVIVREVLGLTDAISMTVVDPIRDQRGWRFSLDAENRDPVTGAEFLSELYQRTDPSFTGRVTVPTLYDTRSGSVVTNDYPQLSLDLSTEWTALHRPGAPNLYPGELREEIDAVAEEIYRDVNNGVYRAGFATTQDSYEEAYTALFARLDALERRLRTRRYLVGDQLTEADVRLFTTLVRFDAVYHGHFKCNLRKLTEYPVLWDYAKRLFQLPGLGSTTNFDHIKRHYYRTHDTINPTGIVPLGPDPRVWIEATQRP